MNTAGAIASDVLALLLIIGFIFVLHKFSQLNKSVYIKSGQVAGTLMGESDATIKTQSSNASAHYNSALKWTPFIIATIFLVLGILRITITPKDEKGDDEKGIRLLVGFALIGGAGLFVTGGVINLFVNIF